MIININQTDSFFKTNFPFIWKIITKNPDKLNRYNRGTSKRIFSFSKETTRYRGINYFLIKLKFNFFDSKYNYSKVNSQCYVGDRYNIFSNAAFFEIIYFTETIKKSPTILITCSDNISNLYLMDDMAVFAKGLILILTPNASIAGPD